MASIEDRLNVLEGEVANLKQQVLAAAQNGNWLEQLSGSFRDQPEFDEVLRLGREFRQQQAADDLDLDACTES